MCYVNPGFYIYIYYWYVPCLVADVKGDFLNVLREPWFLYIYYWYVPCLVADVKGDFLNVLHQPWFLYIYITGMYHVL